jgi:proteasome lid subunit RPN8/RPN11
MTIARDSVEDIRRHGEDTYPEECCGFLLGRAEADGNVVHATRPAVNRNEDRRNDRYVISPDDYRSAEKAAAEAGLDVVGMYHSHPDHPAHPSQTDLETATFPGYTYVIVSIRGGRAAELTAWTLAPDRSKFLSEDVRDRPAL